MALTDRIPYQALIDRPKLVLPGGKKLAVWVILNVEEWRIENAMPRTVLSPPMGQPLLPDVPNWSWHEYGMRAGFWRQLKALTDRNIPTTLAINGNVCTSYPRVAEAAREAGFEFMGHGFLQGPMHKVENQGDAIKRAVDTIAKFAGKPRAVMGKPRPHRDGRDARSAAPQRHRICRGLGDRRSSARHRHTARHDHDNPLHGRDQRHRRARACITCRRINSCGGAWTSSTGCISKATRMPASWPSRSIPTSQACRTGSNISNSLLDYVIGHDGVALMTASEIGDWYRGQMAKA